MGRNQLATRQKSDPIVLWVEFWRGLKPGQRAARAALTFLLGVGCFLSLFPWGRSLTLSALLLPALMNASEPALLVLAGSPVRFKRVTVSSAHGPVFLDIYEPATPPPLVPGGREAVIDVVGVGDNRTVPQLVNLSQSFAREGIVVVNVGTPALFHYQVSAHDGEAVVQAFELLERWPGVDPHRIGIIAFSAGVTLACIGAADPRIRDRVAFLAILGGYFEVTSLLRTQSWQPVPTPLHTLASTVSSLLPPAENQLLQEAFPEDIHGPPLTVLQQAQLSSDTAAFYHLLEGDEPSSVDHNLSALSPQMKALLIQLSPVSVVEQIRAPIHLLHDRNDPSIPFSQSQEFAAALARLHHPYDFAAYSIFSHVEVQSNLSMAQWMSDGTRLFQVLNSLLLTGS